MNLMSSFVRPLTVLGAVFGVLCVSGLQAQAVQLKDGSILVGEVQDADGEGFTLLRTDNGGVLKLRWSHLSQASARRIKEAENLLATDDDEVLVRADVLTYRDSAGRLTEAIGRISKQDATFIYVRKRGNYTPVPRKRIQGKRQREVPPTEIFTEEEYYNQLLLAAAPGEDADKHLQLGADLMKVRDYTHAERHLKKAEELGGGKQSQVLAKQMQRLGLLKAAKAERGLLDAIRTYTNRAQFPAAKAKIDEFRQNFGQSKLLGDLVKLEQKYKLAREKKLVRDVTRLWYKYVSVYAQKKAADYKVTLAMAKQYAERELGKEIRARIAELAKIEVAEVEEFWGKRMEQRGATQSQRYYYSVGSWVLGEKAILKDTKQGKAETEAAQAATEKEQKLAKDIKRIQEALKRSRERMRQRNRNQRKNKKKEVTPEDWWKTADKAARTTWLKAYYGEFSGDMVVTSQYLSNCTTCGGVGTVAVQGTIGGPTSMKCPMCHGTRFRREIRVK